MKKIILLSFLSALLCLLAVLAGAYYLYLPPKHHQVNIDFTIHPGQNLKQVSQTLEAEGVIKNQLALRLWAKYRGTAHKIQAGNFKLSSDLNLDQILQIIQSQPEQLSITILPGWRREEIGEYLSTLPLDAFDEQEFLALSATLEGQLAPETYKIAPLSTAKTIVNILHRQFLHLVQDEKITAQLAARNLSLMEAVTLASLIQREGKTATEMAMIATILNSRLADHYPLQLCASAQYATGKNSATGKWWEPPTLADTKFDSPYNTYQVKGLPPTPICAISMEALKAVLSPTPNDYYYYLHDDSGQIHYAKTLEEHQANVAQYLR